MKLTSKINFRVVIEPATWYKKGNEKYESDARQTCESIIESIRRHVDDIQRIHWEFETVNICSYCGYEWETDETGFPLCCCKAQDEFNLKQL